jgi:hypothetical protein
VDFLKLFPTLLLDMVSKVVPGFFLVFVFHNHLPATSLVLEALSIQSLPTEWHSWGSLLFLTGTAYGIGIFIAMLANEVDSQLLKRHWYKHVLLDPESFVFKAEHPKEMAHGLTSPGAFVLFIDHCRSAVLVDNSGVAAMLLEKYRTAFRLFVGLSLALLALPLETGLWSMAFVSLFSFVTASLAYRMSGRYCQKSIQLYSLSQSAIECANKPQ